MSETQLIKKSNFTDRLQQQVILGDGAMGTMLYEHGAFLNTCFDELNLTNPQMVKKVHTSYVEVGVDFIETNTFGASEFKLARYGLADKVEEINRQGVQLAKAATEGTEVLVAGSIGPLGVQLSPLGNLPPEQAKKAFARQIKALAEAGADLLIMETFSNPDELLLAVDAAAEISSLPIIAQLTVNEHQETMFGCKLQDAFLPVARHPAVTAVGLNCSNGPAIMLSSLEIIRSLTDKPISVQPNAGMPRQVEGRNLYMSTPEYMAEYAKRFLEKGARIIGGCCGTSPEHIRAIVQAVRPLDKASSARPLRIRIMDTEQVQPQQLPSVPLEKKSRLGLKLAQRQMITTIEVTPPRGCDLSGFIDKVKLCADHGIDCVNIPDGPRASARMSPIISAIRIIQELPAIEPILHVCCRDKNIIGLQSDMLGAHAIGLRNILIITGDPPKLGEYPEATAVFDLDSIGLTAVVRNLNHGVDLGGNQFSPPLAMTLGVGANPVAADLPREISRFRRKVQAGAEYAVTQPVFDVDMLLQFMDEVDDCHIPLIAGIWPFTSYKNAEFMANEVPGVVVPDELLSRMSQAKTRQAGRRLGIEIAREMIEKIDNRVAGFAVSAPFGNVNIALAVLGQLDINDIA